jgi:hypothetical protein
VIIEMEMEGHGRSWKELMEGHGRSWKVMEGHGRNDKKMMMMIKKVK